MDSMKEKIQFIMERSDSVFDRAISDLIRDYGDRFSENKAWKESTQSQIDEMTKSYENECALAGEDEYIEPPITCMDYIEAVHENNGAHFFEEAWNEELMAIHEMQIIYSFKQIEISLKQFLLLLDSNIELKSVQRWDDLKKVLNQKGISIGSVCGYSNVNALREVNNALKHSHKISEKVKILNVRQFVGQDYFCPSTLNEFYTSILESREKFLEGVKNLVENKLGNA